MNHQKFRHQFEEFIEQSKRDGRFTPEEKDIFAILDEDTSSTAIHQSFDYLCHTAWAARVLAATKPIRHVDIGSYVYFAGLCSAWVPQFEFYDMRPIDAPLSNLYCGMADLTKLQFSTNSLASLSCLHSLEHVGLGRYGDKLDSQGDLKAAAELSRVLKPGGLLLMVLPLDSRPRVVFNAHRLYSYEQAVSMFAPLTVKHFTLIHDGQMTADADPSLVAKGTGCNSTGCFIFTKI